MKYLVILVAIALAISIGFNISLLFLSNPDNISNDIKSEPSERYVYLAVFKDQPLIEADVRGLQQFAKDYNVAVEIVAPDQYDVVEQARLIEQVIKTKPDGMMICGSDQSLTQYINKAIDAGIPTIMVDADIEGSKRISYVGSDWNKIGSCQAEAMVQLIHEKGTVAMMGIIGAENMQDGFDGFREVMAQYEDIYVLEDFDDMGTVEEAERLTKKLIEEYEDLKGIAGFDSNSGIGIAKALKEMGLEGKIKVTCVDTTSEHLSLLKEGYIQKLVGQRRELFTYFGGVVLYDFNHSVIEISSSYNQFFVAHVPQKIDTGVNEVDLSNVNEFQTGR